MTHQLMGRRMAGSKGFLLGMMLGSVVSTTVVVFLYLSSSSPADYSFPVPFPFRPARLIDEEIIPLDRYEQYPYVCPEAYQNKRSTSESSSNDSTTVQREASEVIMEGVGGPRLQMEQTRRNIAQTTRDMWLFARWQLKRLQHDHETSIFSMFNSLDKIFKYTLDNLSEYHSAVQDQIKHLADNDGWNTWRKKEMQRLQVIMQGRIRALQNPKNCSTAPVLLCDLTNPHGFASGIHDILWCFVKAYYSNKRLVLVTSSWHYAPGGWNTFFRPLTDTCGNEMGPVASTGPGKNGNDARALLALLPSDLGPRIIRMHGNPLVWWYSQFLFYLMRPNFGLKTVLQDLKRKINFNDTIVGLHVRRTDKIGREAKSHRLEEYMEHVEDFFKDREMIGPLSPPIQRRVYLATDDPHVITECQNRFKEYTCIYNSEGATMASEMQTRYSNASIWAVLMDVFMLANTDFLVCTFSSGLCRLAYELMQALKPEDASDRFVSLDVEYYYAYLSPLPRRAIYRHRAKSAKELNFGEGEIFQKIDEDAVLHEAIKGERQSGFAYFVKSWQSAEGLIPTFKTKEIYRFFRGRNFGSTTNDQLRSA